MTHPRPRALEAFAGAGGAALGLRAAGFSAIACLEWDKDAAATLAAAGFPAVHGDVRAYTPAERPDLLWASPPCQAWSSAGKRQGATDERNGWPWTFDLVDRAQPTWLVCENVPGLLQHTAAAECDRAGSEPTSCPGCYWLAVILPEARRRFAVVEWRVLDAASFGVPQRRHRVLLVCGPTAIRWPEPTHADPDTLRQGSMFGPRLQPWRTVRQALNLGSPVYSAGVTGEGRPTGPDEPTATISGMGTAYVVYKRGRDGGVADEAHTVDEPACALRGAPGGSSQPFLVTRSVGERTLDPDRPAFTLRAQGGTDASGHEGGHASVYVPDPKHPPFNPDEPAGSIRSGGGGHSAPQHLLDMPAPGIRRLTVAECATLQDFPPDHPWQGTQTSRYRQVGNAVPPTLARVVGEAVADAMDRTANKIAPRAEIKTPKPCTPGMRVLY